MNRNEPPFLDEDIARCLRDRFGRIHGQDLTADKVRRARAGHAVFRNQIEIAGGGSLLPERSRSRVILGNIRQAS